MQISSWYYWCNVHPPSPHGPMAQKLLAQSGGDGMGQGHAILGAMIVGGKRFNGPKHQGLCWPWIGSLIAGIAEHDTLVSSTHIHLILAPATGRADSMLREMSDGKS